MNLDINATGRTIHALAALRDSDGNVAAAAGKLGIAEETLRQAIAEGGPTYFEQVGGGLINPTVVGLRFAGRIDTFPHVTW